MFGDDAAKLAELCGCGVSPHCVLRPSQVHLPSSWLSRRNTNAFLRLQLKGVPWVVRDARTCSVCLACLPVTAAWQGSPCAVCSYFPGSLRRRAPGRSPHRTCPWRGTGQQWVPGADSGDRQRCVCVCSGAGHEKVSWSVENKHSFYS